MAGRQTHLFVSVPIISARDGLASAQGGVLTGACHGRHPADISGRFSRGQGSSVLRACSPRPRIRPILGRSEPVSIAMPSGFGAFLKRIRSSSLSIGQTHLWRISAGAGDHRDHQRRQRRRDAPPRCYLRRVAAAGQRRRPRRGNRPADERIAAGGARLRDRSQRAIQPGVGRRLVAERTAEEDAASSLRPSSRTWSTASRRGCETYRNGIERVTNLIGSRAKLIDTLPPLREKLRDGDRAGHRSVRC